MSGIAWGTVLNAIHDVFKTKTAVTTAWGRQPKMPEPIGPACMLRRLGRARRAHPDHVVKNYDSGTDTMKVFVTGQREFTIRAEVYSDSIAHATHAQSILENAVEAFEHPSVIRALKAANVAVIDIGEIIDLSEIAGANWRSRAAVDVLFRTTSNREDTTVDPIERIKKTIKLKDSPEDATPIIISTDTG